MTKRLEIFERSPVSTSVRPSLKYSCSGSPLRFTNGSTMREGLSGKGSADWVLGVKGWVPEIGREKYWTATITPTRSPRLMTIRLRTDEERARKGGTETSRVCSGWRKRVFCGVAASSVARME